MASHTYITKLCRIGGRADETLRLPANCNALFTGRRRKFTFPEGSLFVPPDSKLRAHRIFQQAGVKTEANDICMIYMIDEGVFSMKSFSAGSTKTPIDNPHVQSLEILDDERIQKSAQDASDVPTREFISSIPIRGIRRGEYTSISNEVSEFLSLTDQPDEDTVSLEVPRVTIDSIFDYDFTFDNPNIRRIDIRGLEGSHRIDFFVPCGTSRTPGSELFGSNSDPTSIMNIRGPFIDWLKPIGFGYCFVRKVNIGVEHFLHIACSKVGFTQTDDSIIQLSINESSIGARTDDSGRYTASEFMTKRFGPSYQGCIEIVWRHVDCVNEVDFYNRIAMIQRELKYFVCLIIIRRRMEILHIENSVRDRNGINPRFIRIIIKSDLQQDGGMRIDVSQLNKTLENLKIKTHLILSQYRDPNAKKQAEMQTDASQN